MNNTRRVLGALLAGALLLAPAYAQLNQESHDPNSQIVGGPDHSSSSKKPGKPGSHRPGMDAADENFLKTTAHDGLAEVQLGKLATEKASNQEVKNFGQRMMGDHTKANDDLKTLAEKKGLTLPTSPKASDQSLQSKLSQLSGQQFDSQYMQAMLQNHKQSVAEFKKEANDAKDMEVKAFAGKYLPILEDHLHQAQDIEKRLGGKNKGQ